MASGVSYTPLLTSAPCGLLPNFLLLKMPGLPLFRGGRKGQSCRLFKSFIVLAQPTPVKSTLRDGLGLALGGDVVGCVSISWTDLYRSVWERPRRQTRNCPRLP